MNSKTRTNRKAVAKATMASYDSYRDQTADLHDIASAVETLRAFSVKKANERWAPTAGRAEGDLNVVYALGNTNAARWAWNRFRKGMQVRNLHWKAGRGGDAGKLQRLKALRKKAATERRTDYGDGVGITELNDIPALARRLGREW